MPDLVDTTALHHAVDQLAHAVGDIARQAGDGPAVRRLQNDVERLKIDVGDCGPLQPLAPPRALEVIPDTPYDESLWRGVDDEGLGGGFHQPAPPTTRHRSHR